MPDTKQSITAEEFRDRIREGPAEDGFVFLEDLHVEDPPGKGVLSIPFERTPVRHLRLRRCVLPKTDFVGHDGDELGFVLTFQEVASPRIHVRGAVTDLTTSEVHLGTLYVSDVRGMRTATLGGRIDTLVLAGRPPERIEWDSLLVRHLDIRIPPCAATVAERYREGRPPLIVHGWIRATHAAWARYCSLLCPGIPVLYDGNPKRL